ncbi:hypothetical protein [Oceanobacillus kapialis]|uniref:Uncharacterized protein n=1 Tax=Oceanobacillus kapialis TaxID=481353 RepID=A0ABW5PWV2_9BACI
MLYAINAKMPVLNCLFDHKNSGNYGYWLEDNASGKVMNGCGIKNAGVKGNHEHRGLYVGRGNIFLEMVLFFQMQVEGAHGLQEELRHPWSLQTSMMPGDAGIYVSRNSTVYMPYSSVLNASGHALWVQRTSRLNEQDGINLFGAKRENTLYYERIKCGY